MRFRKPATFDFTDNNVGVSVSDCRDEDGITIGLIDGIISTCRILKDRNFNDPNVKEALKDLSQDSDLKFILEKGNETE